MQEVVVGLESAVVGTQWVVVGDPQTEVEKISVVWAVRYWMVVGKHLLAVVVS
jgi:hypothetical protein